MQLILVLATLCPAFALSVPPLALTPDLVKDCEPPNKDLVVTSCLADSPVSVNPAEVKMTPYPPYLKFNLDIPFINNEGTILTYLVNVTNLGFYGIYKGTCGWHTVVTKPKILSACTIKGNCPLLSGPGTRAGAVDLTSYAPLIGKMIGSTKFQFDLSFQEHEGLLLNCLNIQFYPETKTKK